MSTAATVWIGELSHAITSWHHQASNVLFLLLGLHVAAIAFYTRVKKSKLVRPMVTGWKEIPADLPPPRRARRLALLAALAIGLATSYGASGKWLNRASGASDTFHASSTADSEKGAHVPSATSPSTSSTDSTATGQQRTPSW